MLFCGHSSPGTLAAAFFGTEFTETGMSSRAVRVARCSRFGPRCVWCFGFHRWAASSLAHRRLGHPCPSALSVSTARAIFPRAAMVYFACAAVHWRARLTTGRGRSGARHSTGSGKQALATSGPFRVFGVFCGKNSGAWILSRPTPEFSPRNTRMFTNEIRRRADPTTRKIPPAEIESCPPPVRLFRYPMHSFRVGFG